jgi:hypothetical protein
MQEQTDKKKKRGPKPKAAEDRREHCVSVRLNPAELAKLDAMKGQMQRGEAMRFAFLGTPPQPAPPAVNVRAWQQLARVQANLNQLARAANAGDAVEIKEVLEAVREFRNALIGVQL